MDLDNNIKFSVTSLYSDARLTHYAEVLLHNERELQLATACGGSREND